MKKLSGGGGVFGTLKSAYKLGKSGTNVVDAFVKNDFEGVIGHAIKMKDIVESDPEAAKQAIELAFKGATIFLELSPDPDIKLIGKIVKLFGKLYLDKKGDDEKAKEIMGEARKLFGEKTKEQIEVLVHHLNSLHLPEVPINNIKYNITQDVTTLLESLSMNDSSVSNEKIKKMIQKYNPNYVPDKDEIVTNDNKGTDTKLDEGTGDGQGAEDGQGTGDSQGTGADEGTGDGQGTGADEGDKGPQESKEDMTGTGDESSMYANPVDTSKQVEITTCQELRRMFKDKREEFSGKLFNIVRKKIESPEYHAKLVEIITDKITGENKMNGIGENDILNGTKYRERSEKLYNTASKIFETRITEMFKRVSKKRGKLGTKGKFGTGSLPTQMTQGTRSCTSGKCRFRGGRMSKKNHFYNQYLRKTTKRI